MTLDNQPICCHGSLLSQLKSFRCKASIPSYRIFRVFANSFQAYFPRKGQKITMIFLLLLSFTGLFWRVVVLLPCSLAASLNSGFLINCHCRGKMWPTSREQWDNEGGGEWMVGMGREQGRNSPQAQFSPGPASPLWKYCHCSWKLYTHTTMIGLIPNHPVVPQVIGQSHLSSPINYCQYQPRCLGKLMYWLNAPRLNYKW